jgi:hypothetical protein
MRREIGTKRRTYNISVALQETNALGEMDVMLL